MFAHTLLVTGGAGFIGSHVIRLLVNKYPNYHIVNVDALTYAGNLESIADIADYPNYTFEHVSITDAAAIQNLFDKYQPNGIIHLAAESHVDRSIANPMEFIMTNIIGTVNLLNAAKSYWKAGEGKFYHISTDEVFGTLPLDGGYFTENTPYSPNSPYSASKASSDHLVRAYYHTYGLPIVISNCSNNYGPNQYPEKLIPVCIQNIQQGKPLPIYGDGKNVRDWLYVEDHAAAIDCIYHTGTVGETYAIGGENEYSNLVLVELLCDEMDKALQNPAGTSRQLITFVKDRAGHDMRYAIDTTKIKKELGWKPSVTFEQGLQKTIQWYIHNIQWLHNLSNTN